MNLAIIPARGGSKRIPKKNISSFAGQPLIAYSIQAAKKSGLFDAIWVSTDCEQVAEVALHYGAEVPFIRPAELSDDYVGTSPVIQHAIQYAIEQDLNPRYCCCIYATAPFLQVTYLQQAFRALKEAKDKCFAFSCTSFAFPIQRALTLQNNGVAPMYPEFIGQRSQDLIEAFHDAGQFYWGTCEGFLSKKGIFSEHAIPVILPRHLVQDIDTAEDWQRAELMYQAYMKNIDHNIGMK